MAHKIKDTVFITNEMIILSNRLYTSAKVNNVVWVLNEPMYDVSYDNGKRCHWRSENVFDTIEKAEEQGVIYAKELIAECVRKSEQELDLARRLQRLVPKNKEGDKNGAS